MREADTQKAVLDWLQAKRVLAFRMNTGAVKAEGRFFRFGVPGMADVLAFPPCDVCPECKGYVNCIDKYGEAVGCAQSFSVPCWLEMKAPKGAQSLLQKSFQQQVEEQGHCYLVVRDLYDLEAEFRKRGWA